MYPHTEPTTETTKAPDPTFAGQVVLVIEPAPGDVPAANRLRRLLKVMLRGYGWRCVSVGDREPMPLVIEKPGKAKRKRKAKTGESLTV